MEFVSKKGVVDYSALHRNYSVKGGDGRATGGDGGGRGRLTSLPSQMWTILTGAWPTEDKETLNKSQSVLEYFHLSVYPY